MGIINESEIKVLEETIKKCILLWHEKCLEQIRLETANKRHLEELKSQLIFNNKMGKYN